MNKRKRQSAVGENGFLRCNCCNMPVLMSKNDYVNCPLCGWNNSFALENKFFTQIRKDFYLLKMHPQAKGLIHSYTVATTTDEKLKILHELENSIIWKSKPFVPLYAKNFDFFKSNAAIGKLIRKYSENIHNRHYRYLKTSKKYSFLYNKFVKGDIVCAYDNLRLEQIQKLKTEEMITLLQSVYLAAYNPVYDKRYNHVAQPDTPANEHSKKTFEFLNRQFAMQPVYKIALLKAELAYYDREYEYCKSALVGEILKDLDKLNPTAEITRAIKAYSSFSEILGKI